MSESIVQCIGEEYEGYENKSEGHEQFREGLITELEQALFDAYKKDNPNGLSDQEIREDIEITFINSIEGIGLITSENLRTYYETLGYSPNSQAINGIIEAIDVFKSSNEKYMDEWTDTHETAIVGVQDCAEEYGTNLLLNIGTIINPYAQEHQWSKGQQRRITESLQKSMGDLRNDASGLFAAYSKMEGDGILDITGFRPSFRKSDGFTEEDITFIAGLFHGVYKSEQKRRKLTND